MGKCIVENCENIKSKRSKQYCLLHLNRKYSGKPFTDPIQRARGTGTIQKQGYCEITKDGVSYFEHRFVMEQYLARKLIPGENVHHKNGNRSDNRIENLELWSTKQPYGQRIEDKIAYAKAILATYTDYNDEEWRLP